MNFAAEMTRLREANAVMLEALRAAEFTLGEMVRTVPMVEWRKVRAARDLATVRAAIAKAEAS